MSDLPASISSIFEHKQIVGWIAAVSGLIFVGSLILVPWLVVRIPSDYFAKPRRPRLPFAEQHRLLRWCGWMLKNLIGVLMILAGLIMLVLPGQGLLTVAVGVLLLDFPGKHKLESRFVRVGPVLKSINWVRKKANVAPLELDEVPSDLI